MSNSTFRLSFLVGVVVLVVLVVLVTGVKQSQLLVLRLSLEFDKNEIIIIYLDTSFSVDSKMSRPSRYWNGSGNWTFGQKKEQQQRLATHSEAFNWLEIRIRQEFPFPSEIKYCQTLLQLADPTQL